MKGAVPDYPAARRNGDRLKHRDFKNLSSIGSEVRGIMPRRYAFSPTARPREQAHPS